MEKKVFVIYESSKGRKDVVFISLDKAYCCRLARIWNDSKDLRSVGVRYTVYEFPLDECVTFNKHIDTFFHPSVVSL